VLPIVGNATLTFTSASAATLDYTINSQTGRKQLVRQPFGTTDAAARLVIRDLWWAGTAENGWGINIAQQDRTLFAVWFTYDNDGMPTWFVMPGGAWNENVFTGDIFSTLSSAWVGATYDPTRLRATAIGTLSLNFANQDNVTMIYTINGITQSKVITRQPF
jgi:chitinase